MEERVASPTQGRLIASSARTLIVRYPLSTALPIPLAVTAPAGIRLVTWVFAGLAAQDALGPRGLLVLAREGAAGFEGIVRLATHFREIDIALAEAGESLSPEERALIGRAVLAAASPDETEVLADLIEPLGEGISDNAPPGDAHMIGPGEDGGWRLSGSAVPGHLLLHAEAGWSCHRVARASLHFGESWRNLASSPPLAQPKSLPPTRSGVRGPLTRAPVGGVVDGGGEARDGPQALLALEPVWGEAPTGPLDRAIGLMRGGFAPYRIAG